MVIELQTWVQNLLTRLDSRILADGLNLSLPERIKRRNDGGQRNARCPGGVTGLFWDQVLVIDSIQIQG